MVIFEVIFLDRRSERAAGFPGVREEKTIKKEIWNRVMNAFSSAGDLGGRNRTR